MEGSVISKAYTFSFRTLHLMYTRTVTVILFGILFRHHKLDPLDNMTKFLLKGLAAAPMAVPLRV